MSLFVLIVHLNNAFVTNRFELQIHKNDQVTYKNNSLKLLKIEYKHFDSTKVTKTLRYKHFLFFPTT